MSQVSGNVARPQLRGLLHSSIRKNLILVGITVTVAGVAFKIFHNNARKENYANFYKNYDIEKEFETMRKKGLFDSCPSD